MGCGGSKSADEAELRGALEREQTARKETEDKLAKAAEEAEALKEAVASAPELVVSLTSRGVDKTQAIAAVRANPGMTADAIIETLPPGSVPPAAAPEPAAAPPAPAPAPTAPADAPEAATDASKSTADLDRLRTQIAEAGAELAAAQEVKDSAAAELQAAREAAALSTPVGERVVVSDKVETPVLDALAGFFRNSTAFLQDMLSERSGNEDGTDVSVREAFDAVDTDGSGSIDKEELKSVVAKLKGSVTDAEIDALFTEMDLDKVRPPNVHVSPYITYTLLTSEVPLLL